MAADIKILISAKDSASAVLDKVRASMEQMRSSTAFAALGLGGLASAFSGLSAMSIITAAADSADALNDMAERTGVAGEALSELNYAAKMNGTTLSEVEMALKRVSVQATDAASGGEQASAMFDALGVSIKDAEGKLKSSDTLLQDVADVLNQVEDRTLRTALAVEVFGRSGAELIPLMENMRSAREEAQRLGVVVGEDFQKQAADFNDNLDRMAAQTRMFGVALGNEVLPALNRFMQEFIDAKAIFGGFWAALWNVGTSNPFATPAEQAEKYRNKAADLTSQIQVLASGQNKWFGKDTPEAKARIAELNGELEKTQKLVEYFQRANGQTSNAKGGRGFVNPGSAVPVDADGILSRLKAANEKDTKGGRASKGPDPDADFKSYLANLQNQADSVQHLSAESKLLLDIERGRLTVNEAQRKTLLYEAQEIDQQKEQARLHQEAVQHLEETERAMERIYGDTSKITAQADAERDHVAQIGMTATAIADVVAAKAEDQAATLERRALLMDDIDLSGQLGDQLRKQAQGLRDIAQLKRQGAAKEAGIKLQEDAKKASKEYAKELHSDVKGALSAAFRDTKGDALQSFGDALANVIYTRAAGALADSVADTVIKGGSSAGSSLIDWIFNAKGGVYSSPSLSAYSGGVYNSPQVFAFAKGAGVFGEAGPEAIMPLKRGPDGSLGVQANGGGGASNVTVNVIEDPKRAGTTQQRNEGGANVIDVFVDQVRSAIASDIRSGNGPIPSAMSGTYGLSRAAGAY